MKDEQLLRYSRQIMLPDIDIAGQQMLLDATVLVVGIGGLGSPAALYLAAAGIGRLLLVDDDKVELSNLQRQIAHNQNSIGQNKAESAKQHIQSLNPEVVTEALTYKLSATQIAALVDQADIVLDCTDNAETRYLINDHCWQYKTPLVSGAAIRWEGQVAVFNPNDKDCACYRCLYPSSDVAALNCSENGVIAPLVGIIGTCQVLEAIKVLTGVGETLSGRVLYLDGKYMEWRHLKLRSNPSCPTCSTAKAS